MRNRRTLGWMGLACVLLAGCAGSFPFGRPRPPAGVEPREVVMEVTGYCRCGRCCGWKRDWLLRPVYASGPLKGQRKQVGVTASGTRARPGTLAADTSLYPFGTILFIPGYGYGRVEDRGSAIRGRKVDVFFRSHAQALRWGRQELRVLVWLPERSGS